MNIQTIKNELKENKKVFLKSFFIFIILLNICFVFAASDEYKPYLHKPSVGEYPKLEMNGEYKTEHFLGFKVF